MNNFAAEIRKAVENDLRSPRTGCDVYLQSLEHLLDSPNSILFNGSLFSEFSMYFFRALTLLLVRGDNIVFVCSSDEQSKWVQRYVIEGFSRLASLHCVGVPEDSRQTINFDHPIWRIVRVESNYNVEEAGVDECSILITTLDYLCSSDFKSEHKKFIHLIDTVIYVDILAELNRNREKMAMFNIALQNIAEVNAMRAKNGSINREYRVRYMSRPIRYICFDDTRTPGVDKALKNLLGVSFDTVDIMRYTGKTNISCYRLDGKEPYPKILPTDEQIGLMMNMALFCLQNGAERVSVFPEDLIPYDTYWETINAHAGSLNMRLNDDRLRINRYSYDNEEYSVIFAADSSRNLPAVVRKYASMTAEKPVLLYLFSPPYLFRDYYAERLEEIWESMQFSRIPVEEAWDVKDIARNILLQAEAGGIRADEILQLFESNSVLREYAKEKKVNTILREILGLYGISQKERVELYRYFEYSPIRDFDKNGDYISDDSIGLRKEGVLYDTITGNHMAVLVVGERRIPLPVPKNRLTQNYIAGQNLLCHGNVYHIDSLDTINGEVYGNLVKGGNHAEAYRYVPIRKYYADSSGESLEELFPQKKLILRKQNQDIEVGDITLSFLRVCTEVITEGYYSLDPMTLDINSAKTMYVDLTDKGSNKIAKQTYRRYGQVKNPVYSSERILQNGTLNAGEYGARMMSIRMTGAFGEDFRRTVSLAAVMLNEILQSIFPYTADAIAVCPVLHTPFEEDSGTILDKYPKLILPEGDAFFSKEDFELVIIEDCQADLGVVNALYEAGEEVIHMLFDPILIYLNWYAQSSEKSKYLYGGAEEEPSCFDFDSLHLLAKLLGTDNHLHGLMNTGGIKSKIRCDFCGKRCENTEDITELEDGRKMCRDCGSNLMENNPEVLNSCLEKAKQYLESAYGVSFDEKIEVILEPAEKIRHFLSQNENACRGADFPILSYCEDSKIHVEDNIPAISLSEVLVRELTFLWQKKHTPKLSGEVAEGHIALTGLQYLRFLNRNALAEMRTNYYESTEKSSGKGYRVLLHELLNHPEYKNNPFRCVLAMCGIDESEILIRPAGQITHDNYLLGRSYMPKSYDRCPDGKLTYFYYSRFSAELQKVYDAILEGIRNFSSITVDFPPEKIMEHIEDVVQAIRFDHPELYYFTTVSISGQEIFPNYVMSQSEVEAANKKIENEVQKYLEKIDDSMSAYDVALRLHIQLIENIDYDSIALKRQDRKGGPAEDEIDELRTIYGVFLNNTAVCAGYACAMQYLLQRCGIECAKCAGYIKEEDGNTGDAHGWNILKIDGDYYYLDTTWDDSSNTAQKVKNDSVGFDYFCITTEELTRSRDLKLCPIKEMPVCRADRANYYVHNGRYLRSYDLNRIIEIAKEAAMQSAPFFSFKCATKAIYNQVLRDLLAEGNDIFAVLKETAKVNSSVSESRCTYQYNEKLFVVKVFFKKA